MFSNLNDSVSPPSPPRTFIFMPAVLFPFLNAFILPGTFLPPILLQGCQVKLRVELLIARIELFWAAPTIQD